MNAARIDRVRVAAAGRWVITALASLRQMASGIEAEQSYLLQAGRACYRVQRLLADCRQCMPAY